MSIDLPLDVAPDTVTPSSGKYLQRFGEQLTQTGLQLSGIAGKSLKIFYDAQAGTELTNAKRLMYQRLNEFNNEIIQRKNVDYDTYMDSWSAYSMQLRSDASKIFTLKEPSEVFSQIYDEVDKSQRTWLGTKQIEGMVANSEASLTAALSEAARMGNTEAVLDYAKSGYSYGVLHKDKVQELVAKYLPIAKYNAVYNQLDALGDYKAAMEILTAPGAPKALGITPDQRDDIVMSMSNMDGKNRELAERERVANAEKTYTDFIAKWDSGEATPDEARVASAQVVGTKFETSMRGIVDKLSSAYGSNPLDRLEKEQNSKEFQLLNQLYAWKRNGKVGDSPWTDKTLETLYSTSGLRRDQVTRLTNDWQAADEPDLVVDYRSRIYASILPEGGGKTTPLKWASMEQEITNSYGAGDLTIEQHNSLLALLLQAKGEYEKRIGVTEEAAELEAASKVYDKSLTKEQREQWVRDNKARFSGDDFGKWLGRIEYAAGSTWRGEIFDALTTYYRAAINLIPSTDDAGRKTKTLEMYEAMEAMEGYMVLNPDDITGAEERLRAFKGDQALKDIKALLTEGRMPMSVPLLPTGTGYSPSQVSDARRYETVRELYPKEFAAEVSALAMFESTYRPIAVAEEKYALGKAKITFDTSYRNARGDEQYRGTGSNAGNEFVVRQFQDGNVWREKIYKVVYRVVNGVRQMGYDPL